MKSKSTKSPRVKSVPFVATRRRSSPKRSETQIERETALLLKYVKRHPGERMEQIQDALGFATGKLTLPMRRLVAEKIVRTRGDARGTRYTARA
jgi:hypothetical protein